MLVRKRLPFCRRYTPSANETTQRRFREESNTECNVALKAIEGSLNTYGLAMTRQDGRATSILMLSLGTTEGGFIAKHSSSRLPVGSHVKREHLTYMPYNESHPASQHNEKNKQIGKGMAPNSRRAPKIKPGHTHCRARSALLAISITERSGLAEFVLASSSHLGSASNEALSVMSNTRRHPSVPR